MITTIITNTDSIELKYNERIVEVNEVLHTESRIVHHLNSMNMPIHDAVFKLNMEMPKDESLFFDSDGYLIHKYSQIETYENTEALDRAKVYFRL